MALVKRGSRALGTFLERSKGISDFVRKNGRSLHH